MDTIKKQAYQMPTMEVVEISLVNTILEGSTEPIGGEDLSSVNPVLDIFR